MLNKFMTMVAVASALPLVGVVADHHAEGDYRPCGCEVHKCPEVKKCIECPKPRCRIKYCCKPCKCCKPKCCKPKCCKPKCCKPKCCKPKCCKPKCCKPKKCKRCVDHCEKRECCPPKYYPWDVGYSGMGM